MQEDIEELCKYVDRPLIFPLSNPTSKAEITAEQAINWSHGKAIFAAGICTHPSSPV
jgi:malic enzyme